MTKPISLKISLFTSMLFALIAIASFPAQAHAEESGALWGKVYGGAEIEQFSDVVALDNGDFIAVGYSYGPSEDLGGGVSWGNQKSNDAIVVRFGPDGTAKWAKNFGGDFGEEFNGVAVSADGSWVYVVGSSNGISNNLLSNYNIPDWVNHYKSEVGQTNDGIVMKLDASDGTPVWAHSYGGYMKDDFNDVAVIDDEYIIVVGKTHGEGVTPVWEHKDLFDGIAVKIRTSDGTCAWAKSFGGDGDDQLFAVTYVAGQGIFACGHSGSTSDNADGINWDNLGMTDGILLQIDPSNGALVSAQNYGSTNYDYFRCLEALPDGTIAIGGDSLAPSSNLGSVAWGNSGISDMIAVKYDPATATMLWAQNYGGPVIDSIYEITTNSDGDLYLAGVSEGASTNLIGQSAPAEWQNFGDYDGIVVKIDPASGAARWGQNFGGPDANGFYGASVAPDGSLYAVCGAYETSINLMSLGAPSEWGTPNGTTDTLAVKIAPRYTLTVESGTDQTATGPYFAGTPVNVAANNPASGQEFAGWTGGIGGTFADPLSASTSFTMPKSDSTVTATYRTVPGPGPNPGPDPDPKPNPKPTPVDNNKPAPLAKTGDFGLATILALFGVALVSTITAAKLRKHGKQE